MQTQSKQIDFTGQNFYCGIDTHKKNWAVTIETDEMALKTFSQNPDPGCLVNFLNRTYPGGNYIVGYEAGYFGFSIQRKFKSLGVNCLILNPADIPTSDKDRDQKRDPRDSRKIAKALKNRDSLSIWTPTVSLEEDRQLIRVRGTLSKEMTRTKNRIKAFLQIHGIEYPDNFKKMKNPWTGRFIKWLEEVQLTEQSGTESLQAFIRILKFFRLELLEMTKKIKMLSQNGDYSNKFKKLYELKGIGLITAMTILTEIGDINRFKSVDCFRSFIGFIPSSRSSGEKEYQGEITHRANAHLRYLLIEATWTAVRNDPYYLSIYKEYSKRMDSNKALVRTAGKIANRIYYCLKND